jgi:predicted Zn-dependent protease
MTPESRAHPKVITLRFKIHEKTGNWDLAVEVAGALCRARPKAALPCIYLGRALNGLGNTQGAIDFLSPAADNFPNDSAIPYDLACYCCVVGSVSVSTISSSGIASVAKEPAIARPYRAIQSAKTLNMSKAS